MERENIKQNILTAISEVTGVSVSDLQTPHKKSDTTTAIAKKLATYHLKKAEWGSNRDILDLLSYQYKSTIKKHVDAVKDAIELNILPYSEYNCSINIRLYGVSEKKAYSINKIPFSPVSDINNSEAIKEAIKVGIYPLVLRIGAAVLYFLGQDEQGGIVGQTKREFDMSKTG